jgi:hypothetical protein
VPLALAAGLVMLPNYWVHREPVLSRSSAVFALAYLIGSGTAQRHLDRACQTHHYLLCAERADLRADLDWFLWARDGPRARYEDGHDRANDTFVREAAAIVSRSVREEWPTIAGQALHAALVQLGTFGIHHGSADHTFSAGVAAVMKRIGPAALQAYEASGEAHDALPVTAVSLVQYVVIGLALLVLLACMPAL